MKQLAIVASLLLFPAAALACPGMDHAPEQGATAKTADKDKPKDPPKAQPKDQDKAKDTPKPDTAKSKETPKKPDMVSTK
jgi:hypothetical protein